MLRYFYGEETITETRRIIYETYEGQYRVKERTNQET